MLLIKKSFLAVSGYCILTLSLVLGSAFSLLAQQDSSQVNFTDTLPYPNTGPTRR